jgi:hypothetical protein
MAGDRLFMNLQVQQLAETCQEAAAKAVERFSEEQLAAHGVEELIDHARTHMVPGSPKNGHSHHAG